MYWLFYHQNRKNEKLQMFVLDSSHYKHKFEGKKKVNFV
ncbi:heterogeneous nuclear ribonucleoprotein D, isoform CRA_h [Rattus norvegicus]|uniref:Heterogeneous nuclear ribonucleoprotein D, isoform CRA_h n=1 Tax=Rattus norvegicus TaxID=10116 RepID=A6K629_RAT|nr:heterogeneous nuclear ribonucleoprotein D, isoform CRA_h [Rattus norvegicus]